MAREGEIASSGRGGRRILIELFFRKYIETIAIGGMIKKKKEYQPSTRPPGPDPGRREERCSMSRDSVSFPVNVSLTEKHMGMKNSTTQID